MKVLITGGMGVMGAETSRKFVQEGIRPVIYARHRDESPNIIATPGFREQNFTKLSLEPVAITPEQFAKMIKTDLERWGPIIKASGAKSD